MDSGPAVGSASGQEESTLVARIRAGDSAAEGELVNAYRRGVFLMASARTRDREAARDLTQDVFIAVLKALRSGQLRESDKLEAFIQGTARNLINNYLRTQARRSESELDSIEIPGPDPVIELESAERERLVRHELASFKIADQQILLLSLVDGHSLAEVAQRLNMSHDAVRARKSRMIRKLIKKFGAVVTRTKPETT
jgi:RNA polymerase sigma-70 factor (ECF subfamily)